MVDGVELHHVFESKLLSEEELEHDLRAVGLRRSRLLDDSGAWTEAVPEDRS